MHRVRPRAAAAVRDRYPSHSAAEVRPALAAAAAAAAAVVPGVDDSVQAVQSADWPDRLDRPPVSGRDSAVRGTDCPE